MNAFFRNSEIVVRGKNIKKNIKAFKLENKSIIIIVDENEFSLKALCESLLSYLKIKNEFYSLVKEDAFYIDSDGAAKPLDTLMKR